jgi:hypothetical protein
MKFFPTEARTYVVFRDYFKIFFGSTDFKCSWFKHKLKLIVFKCTIIVLYFWRSKFCFVFKSWTHFCWWKNHQNRTRVDFGIMFSKNVVLHEIYSKKSQWPNTFGTSLYIYIYSNITGIAILYIIVFSMFVQYQQPPWIYDRHTKKNTETW